ncbi:MAG: hypothetical protein PHY16_11165 [Methylobacter sp.]|nr:hypothetical protein [Methylobacter sp.]
MKKLPRSTLWSSAVLMLVAGQSVFAHTGVQNAITSGATGYSAFTITHGCNATVPPTPVVAESVVWPINSPFISTSPAQGQPNIQPVTAISDVLTNTANPPVPLTSLAGLPQLVQNHDVFTQQIEQNDIPGSGGNVIGWVSTRGNLGQHLQGNIPFRFGGFKFIATTCTSAVKIVAAVADICNIKGFQGATPAVPGTNLWLDNTQVGFYGAHIEDGAASASLTVNRDLVGQPYPANCAAAGQGGTDASFVLTIKPSQEDVNKLIFPGWGPGADPSLFY